MAKSPPKAPAKPPRKRKPRIEMCIHRRGADEYCSRCDG